MSVRSARMVLSCALACVVPASATTGARRGPPVFLQYYDWFSTPTWNEREFVDPVDWAAVGVKGADRRSESFYYQQFRYIRSLGVDALSWEFHPVLGKEPTYPGPAALAALARSGLKIAPFYDLEISLKVKNREAGTPTLSNPTGIRPDAEMVTFMASELEQFFTHVPRELLATDKRGRLVIFVFGYGFDDRDPSPSRWSRFADDLVRQVRTVAGAAPTFYWTSAYSPFAEHLFSHHRGHFVPFQFVLDTPQNQFGHDSVTWNFGFDNLGVLRQYNLQRVVRLDPRYVKEMGWLAGATDPSLIFIYGWNEPFEGSLLLPSRNWGDTKAQLARAYIERLRSGRDAALPRTLLIIDDLDERWTSRKNDWHLDVLRELLLYPMRRFAPQADVRMANEVGKRQLAEYEIIIDLSSKKDARLSQLLLAAMPSHRIMIFDPLFWSGGKLSEPFVASAAERIVLDREIDLPGATSKLFAHDDVHAISPCKRCGVKLAVRINSRTVPLVVTRDDDVFVNSYSTHDDVLRTAFEALYDQPMRKSILYGEGVASQRLEIDPKTRQVTYNRLSRYSVNQHWPIPPGIDWFKPPPEIGEEHFRFVFGLDE